MNDVASDICQTLSTGGWRQGLTLVDFPAQPEPFLSQQPFQQPTRNPQKCSRQAQKWTSVRSWMAGATSCKAMRIPTMWMTTSMMGKAQPIIRPSRASCQPTSQSHVPHAPPNSPPANHTPRKHQLSAHQPITRASRATQQPTSQSHAPHTPAVSPPANHTPLTRRPTAHQPITSPAHTN